MSGVLLQLKIANKNYGKISGKEIFITRKLKENLEKIKMRDGTNLYANLITRGFQGGKHLIEILGEKFGKGFRLILSHEISSIKDDTVTINFENFRMNSRGKFFAVYRETGLQAATDFLEKEFTNIFPRDGIKQVPSKTESKKVFASLPAAVETLSKKDQKQLPKKLVDLISKQGPDFVLAILGALDQSAQGGSERLKIALQEVVLKLSKEPAKAMQELSDFMDKWNLHQVTSLLTVLKSRLETISTFEQMITNGQTYELKGDKSIHRILEKSMWLVDDKYWIAQSNKTLREFIGKELEKDDKKHQKKRPDFACVNSSGELLLLEIKRPSLKLKEKEINQAELYLRIAKKYKSENKKPVIYLIGKSISSEARELAELRGYPKLHTYQDIIDGCRQRYQKYLEIVEENT